MLASPYWKVEPGSFDGYLAEEKVDGIRYIVEVDRELPADLLSDSTIRAWTRYGLSHILPNHLRAAFEKLPTGIYDGELYMPGQRSYGATRLENSPHLHFVIFDLLSLMREDTTNLVLRDRRKLLDEMFKYDDVRSEKLTLIEQRRLTSREDLIAFRDDVWARDGEGLIVKFELSNYVPSNRKVGFSPRGKTWIKVKAHRSATLRVIGFEPSKGEIFNRGPYATVVLQDDNGAITTVKTRNDMELAAFERKAQSVPFGQAHPDIGRKLCIEYQERTPDGSYRHPRWDRWEDE
jgi:ATP-dependent DNA ligase